MEYRSENSHDLIFVINVLKGARRDIPPLSRRGASFLGIEILIYLTLDKTLLFTYLVIVA